MPATQSVTITGGHELAAALAKLGKAVTDKGGRDALKAGALIIRDRERTLTPLLASPRPDRTRGLVRSKISAIVLRNASSGFAIEAVVAVRGASRKAIRTFKQKTGKSGSSNPKDPFYWPFINFGTTDKKHLQGVHFMERGFESAKEVALAAILEALKAILRANS